MATARKQTERVTRLVEVEELETSVTLTLTSDEAETLAIIARHIAGSCGLSRRKHTEAIALALSDAGVEAPMLADSFYTGTRGHFLRGADSLSFVNLGEEGGK